MLAGSELTCGTQPHLVHKHGACTYEAACYVLSELDLAQSQFHPMPYRQPAQRQAQLLLEGDLPETSKLVQFNLTKLMPRDPADAVPDVRGVAGQVAA